MKKKILLCAGLMVAGLQAPRAEAIFSGLANLLNRLHTKAKLNCSLKQLNKKIKDLPGSSWHKSLEETKKKHRE